LLTPKSCQELASIQTSGAVLFNRTLRHLR